MAAPRRKEDPRRLFKRQFSRGVMSQKPRSRRPNSTISGVHVAAEPSFQRLRSPGGGVERRGGNSTIAPLPPRIFQWKPMGTQLKRESLRHQQEQRPLNRHAKGTSNQDELHESTTPVRSADKSSGKGRRGEPKLFLQDYARKMS